MAKNPKAFAIQQAKEVMAITKSNSRGGLFRTVHATEQTYQGAISEHLQTLKSEANTLIAGPMKDEAHHSKAEVISEQNNLAQLSQKFHGLGYKVPKIENYNGANAYLYNNHSAAKSGNSAYASLGAFADLKPSEISAIATSEAKNSNKSGTLGKLFKTAVVLGGAAIVDQAFFDGKGLEFAKSVGSQTLDTLKERGGLKDAFLPANIGDTSMDMLNNYMPNSIAQIVLAGGLTMGTFAFAKKMTHEQGGLTGAAVLAAGLSATTLMMNNLESEHDVNWSDNAFIGDYVETGSNLFNGRSIDNPAGPAPGPMQ